MPDGWERTDVTGGDRRGTSTVAWVGLGATARADDRTVSAALHRVGQVVRSDDQVCPVSSSGIAVRFGSVAGVVPLEVLGHRLAGAVGPGLPATGSGRTVAVGMAASDAGGSPDLVIRSAHSAARTSARALDRPDLRASRCAAAVTVNSPVLPAGTPTDRGTVVSLQRRTVHRTSSEPPDRRPAPVPGNHDPGSTTPEPCILVVDPMVGINGRLGLGATSASEVAGRLGCRVGATGAPPDEPPTVAVDGADVDLVVMVLDGAWAGRSPNWSHGSWGHPARLTSDYVDKGVPVLAVGAGASAGTLAACVAQGALPLFALELLGDALRSLERMTVEEARQVAGVGYPAHFQSLLGLTAGERRVLFYLTEGWGAQEIADDLVVSLTTVRSHIRSVLRKLEVRSQLAAVAIANSRILGPHQEQLLP